MDDGVSNEKLVSTNIFEDDFPEWNSKTQYKRSTRIIRKGSHTVYLCIRNHSNCNPDHEQIAFLDPLIVNPKDKNWTLVGSTNLWKLFDRKPSDICKHPKSIQVELKPNKMGLGVGLVGLHGTSCRIKMTDEKDGVVYDRTISLREDVGVHDWRTYFTVQPSNVSNLTILDLPLLYGEAKLSITIDNKFGFAECGQIIVGDIVDLGFATYDGTGFKGQDFSAISHDAYGNLEVVKRKAIKIFDFSVVVKTPDLKRIERIFQGLRGAGGAVWIGNDNSRYAASIYGFSSDYSVNYSDPITSDLSIEIKGFS